MHPCDLPSMPGTTSEIDNSAALWGHVPVIVCAKRGCTLGAYGEAPSVPCAFGCKIGVFHSACVPVSASQCAACAMPLASPGGCAAPAMPLLGAGVGAPARRVEGRRQSTWLLLIVSMKRVKLSNSDESLLLKASRLPVSYVRLLIGRPAQAVVLVRSWSGPGPGFCASRGPVLVLVLDLHASIPDGPGPVLVPSFRIEFSWSGPGPKT